MAQVGLNRPRPHRSAAPGQSTRAAIPSDHVTGDAPVGLARVPTPLTPPAGYKKRRTLAAKGPFSSTFPLQPRAPPAAVQRRLAVAPTTHFSIPSGQRTSVSSRSFCPGFCSSRPTPSTSAPDHAAVIRHRW
jgi:hypothetical protein